MKQQAVPLFIPPAVRPRSAPEAQRFPVLPIRRGDNGLDVAVSRIDHSGRVGDRHLIGDLGWQAGDCYNLTVSPDGATVSMDPSGDYRMDLRRHVFLPVATRQLLGIDVGDRLVLVACREQNRLTIHPVALVTELLRRHYATASAVNHGR
ncbi:hypothetical protein [Umezawaea sp. Da 62-37]|uniref:hypothetical protein n=1 Tax=Umezawaea sp. Da 62-37 TaxID=3075927 RepID=UPI0028F705DA|nr:hypothetical protein [Umezawaea sp. Da 62-37]WNV84753.1 hypothetical protein RM788_42420 [Umezawaea sp. Da 62-37]